jgi:hypothetical protein
VDAEVSESEDGIVVVSIGVSPEALDPLSLFDDEFELDIGTEWSRKALMRDRFARK